jgi:hypothetical protein
MVPLKKQGLNSPWLHKTGSGYYQYRAVPGNIHQQRLFRRRVKRLWQSARAISRRGI